SWNEPSRADSTRADCSGTEISAPSRNAPVAEFEIRPVTTPASSALAARVHNANRTAQARRARKDRPKRTRFRQGVGGMEGTDFCRSPEEEKRTATKRDSTYPAP